MNRSENGQFSKGQSGNNRGRPKGARNHTTMATLALLDGEYESLTRKAIELALEGDITAIKICLDRIAPPAKEKPLQGFDLPEITDTSTALQALSTVADRLASGELLPSEAGSICKVLEQYRRHFETTEIQQRLESIEDVLARRDNNA